MTITRIDTFEAQGAVPGTGGDAVLGVHALLRTQENAAQLSRSHLRIWGFRDLGGTVGFNQAVLSIQALLSGSLNSINILSTVY